SAHATARAGPIAWARNLTASIMRPSLTRSRINAEGVMSGRSFDFAWSLSAACPINSATERSGCFGSGMSIDHCQVALHGHDPIRAHGRHYRFRLELDSALNTDHHALDGDALLVENDAALSYFQLDLLHGLVRGAAQFHFRGLIAHADGNRLVARTDLRGLVACIDGDRLVSLIDGQRVVAFLDRDRRIFRDGLGV